MLTVQRQQQNFTLTDNRKTLGETTRVLKIPFNAWTFSVGTTPMRFRAKTDSSSSTVSATLSLSLGFGYTFGCSQITGRSINNYSVTVAPFIGLATAELKKENSYNLLRFGITTRRILV